MIIKKLTITITKMILITRISLNTTPNLQDQDHEQERFSLSQTGLVLKPTVSDHITAVVALMCNK